MICALVLDLNGSQEFRVDRSVLGRALAVYPLMAAKASHYIDRTYLVTDSPEVKALALQYQTIIVDRAESRGADASIAKAYPLIVEDLKRDGESLEFAAVMFTHVPTVTSELIDIGVDTLREFADADSAVSVSKYNHFSPYAALRETKDSRFEPYILAEVPPPQDVWYPDWGVAIARPRSLENLAQGPRPYPWLGRRVAGLKQWGGGPIEASWQVAHAEHWLKQHGLSDLSPTMERQPKPQPAPKADRR